MSISKQYLKEIAEICNESGIIERCEIVFLNRESGERDKIVWRKPDFTEMESEG